MSDWDEELVIEVTPTPDPVDPYTVAISFEEPSNQCEWCNMAVHGLTLWVPVLNEKGKIADPRAYEAGPFHSRCVHKWLNERDGS